jgi:hypothetical protein
VPEARDIAKMKREEERMERVDGKSDGGPQLYNLAREVSLADGGRVPNVAGGEGGHGAAKPDSVIHRYFTRQKIGSPS